VKRAVRWLDLELGVSAFVVAAAFAPRGTAWVAGITLAALTLPVWILARLQLGSAFSVRAQATGLVTVGLYRYVRHPVYVFGSAAVVGILVAFLGWRGAIWAAILAVVQSLRARKEDAVLAGRFGEAYEAYRRTTWL